MKYEEDCKIDETALDVEWLEQSELAMKYGEHWVRCNTKYLRAEERIKVVRSELVKMAYDNPDKHLGKGVKATAQTVEAYYRNHPKHISAKEDWIQAMEDLKMAEVAKWEISNTRKQALENLVILHGQKYFAGPSIPRNLTYEKERRIKKRNKGISNNLNKTRKRTK